MRKMIGIMFAVFMAMFLIAAIPASISAEGETCPECGYEVEYGVELCPTCGHLFTWEEERGNTLISDSGNNRVIEVDSGGNIVWQITVNEPFDAERLANGNTLIVERDYPNPSRVIEVDSDGTIVWFYDVGLYVTVDAEKLDNGNILISDEWNDRVIEVDYTTKAIVWELTGIANPKDAERLDNGNTLVAELYADRVKEFDSLGNVVWQSPYWGGISLQDCERLDNGNTLITGAAGFSRVREIDSADNIIWDYPTGTWVADAERLPNGNTLIADGYGVNRVYEVDNSGAIVWEVTGLSFNWPMDVERIEPSYQPPVADAGADQTVNEGDEVLLDGSNSVGSTTGGPSGGEPPNGEPPEEEPPTEELWCPECGGEIDSSMTQCPHCGADLGEQEIPPEEEPPTEELWCPECGGEIDSSMTQCPHCGADLGEQEIPPEEEPPTEELWCPECGGEIDSSMTQCPHCGADLGEQEIPPEEEPPTEELWCPECGGEIDSSMTQCPHCGAELGGGEPPQEEPPQEEPGTSAAIATYEWDFETDGTYDYQETPSNAPDGAFDGITTHAYGDNGVYTVTLRITDDLGESATDTCVIAVNNVAPIVSIDEIIQPFDEFILPHNILEFYGSFTDQGWEDTHSIEWDFGNGDVIIGTLTPTYAYAEPGTYTVTLSVTDDDGGLGTDTFEVIVLSVEEASEQIIEDVINMDLQQGNENSLLSKLENAIETMDNNNTNPAVNILNAFINQIEAMVNAGKLSEEEADALIESIRWIIEELEAY